MGIERLVSAESLLQPGQISVRDFVRSIANSEPIGKSFFIRTHKLGLSSLITSIYWAGLPTANQRSFHVELYNSEGYEAEINSYIDSAEYQENFGENIVPYYRGFRPKKGKKPSDLTGYSNYTGVMLLRSLPKSNPSPADLGSSEKYGFADIHGLHRPSPWGDFRRLERPTLPSHRNARFG